VTAARPSRCLEMDAPRVAIPPTAIFVQGEIEKNEFEEKRTLLRR
jgi:hypothetical protein